MQSDSQIILLCFKHFSLKKERNKWKGSVSDRQVLETLLVEEETKKKKKDFITILTV